MSRRDNRLIELAELFIERDLDLDGEGELLSLVERSPEALDKFRALLEMNAHLEELTSPDGHEAIWRALKKRISSAGTSRAFTLGVVDRVRRHLASQRRRRATRRRAATSARHAMIAAAVAALLFVVGGTYYLYGSQRGDRRSRSASVATALEHAVDTVPVTEENAPVVATREGPARPPASLETAAVDDPTARPADGGRPAGAPRPARGGAETASVEPKEEGRGPDTAPPRTAAVPATPGAAGTVGEVDPSYGESIGYLAASQGDVRYTRAGAGRWSRATEGTVLSLGDGVRTRVSRARIALQSGTVVSLNRSTTLTLVGKTGSPGLSIIGGEVYVETVPADEGFSVETPHGRVVDLGTRFGLEVGHAGTRVVVVQGRAEASTDKGKAEIHAGEEILLVRRTGPPGPVREARNLDGRLAWARGMKRGVGSTDEIVLSARDAKIRGNEWRFVKDPEASTRFAVEAHAHSVMKENMPRLERGQLGCVEYTFKAELGRTYHVWIRDRLTATREPRYLYDLLCLRAEGATWDPPGTKVGASEIEGGLFDEFIDVAGYRWRSGWGDRGHVTVRFARAGLQKLRLYALESPVRVDLVWLSTTRTARPAGNEIPRPSGGR